jgi:hypothetical protein
MCILFMYFMYPQLCTILCMYSMYPQLCTILNMFHSSWKQTFNLFQKNPNPFHHLFGSNVIPNIMFKSPIHLLAFFGVA